MEGKSVTASADEEEKLSSLVMEFGRIWGRRRLKINMEKSKVLKFSLNRV